MHIAPENYILKYKFEYGYLTYLNDKILCPDSVTEIYNRNKCAV